MDMIIYFVIVLTYSLSYIQSMVIGETDENGEIPKSRKFYELSCTIWVLYGILGYISSRSVFEVADYIVQFVLIIQWILLIIALALQLLSGYQSLKERKRHKIPKDDDTHRERNTYNENEVN